MHRKQNLNIHDNQSCTKVNSVRNRELLKSEDWRLMYMHTKASDGHAVTMMHVSEQVKDEHV